VYSRVKTALLGWSVNETFPFKGKKIAAHMTRAINSVTDLQPRTLFKNCFETLSIIMLECKFQQYIFLVVYVSLLAFGLYFFYFSKVENTKSLYVGNQDKLPITSSFRQTKLLVLGYQRWFGIILINFNF
jgi:hypothetical protein